MLVTRFNAKESSNKNPVSPYGDQTFDFETLECNPRQIMRLMANEYILNTPLKESGVQRLRRRKSDLSGKTVDRIEYLVIDINHLTNKPSFDTVLKYFEQYQCILIESNTFNAVDNFNLKGMLICDLDVKHAKFALSKIHRDLENFCTVNEAMARTVAITAPIKRFNVVLSNTNCEKKFEYSDIDVGYVIKKNTLSISLPSSLDEARSIPELCLKVFTSMGFNAFGHDEANKVLRFSHASEQKTPGGFYWFADSPYRMNHFNPSRTIDIYNDIKNLAIFKSLYHKPIDYKERFSADLPNVNTLTVNTPELQITPEIEKMVETFIDGENVSLCIKSAMGTGKSNVINYCIQQAHDRDMRVLIITNRISVAEDFAHKYNLKIYNKDKYQLGDSLICQFDSLHHYSIRYFDVVIMDEFLSLLFHSRCNLSHNSANSARFYSALNRKVIVADAFINDFSLKLIKFPILKIENEWRDPAKVVLYDDFNMFMQVLLRTAKSERVTVSCTSLNVINAIQLLLIKHELKVCTLTSATPQVSKEVIYNHFKTDSPPWDVLIFSPTLTVGVSNLNNVRCHFHYDSSMSNDVVSSAQMCKRTRKAEEIHVHIKSRYQVLKTEYEDIKSFYMSCSVASEDNFMFDLNDYGELKVSRLGRKAIMVDQMRNILEVNHKSALIYIMGMHFQDLSNVLHNTMYQNILNPYLKQCRENEKMLMDDNIKQFKDLNGIDGDLPSDALSQIESVMSVIDPNCPCKIDILKKSLSSRNFIDTCKKHNIFKEWTGQGVASDYYKIKMSNLILYQDNSPLLKIYANLLKMPPLKYKEVYNRKDISSNHLSLLKECGFSIQSANLGLRQVVLDEDVRQFSQWIL